MFSYLDQHCELAADIIAGPDAIEFCLRHSESKAVFVSTKNWDALTEKLPALQGQIQAVIYWGPGPVNRQVKTVLT